MRSARRKYLVMAFAVACVVALALVGCSKKVAGPDANAGPGPKTPSAEKAAPLPDSAYDLDAGLEPWTDPESGYDTTREWKLDGEDWPILLVMSPSQSPQLLAGWEAGLFQKALGAYGITPTIERIDGPDRTFRALQRSKWPFVYMPLAVFMDYSRGHNNQADAGGLQYVAIAGSTAGGGYTLVSKDDSVASVADLKGKKVGFLNSNPVPGTLFTKALEEAGVDPDEVDFRFGEAGAQLNSYGKGEFDALVTMNIYRRQLLDMGSRIVTDFAGVDYERPNYTILCVERSVLEKRPEVVRAFLGAHKEGHRLATDMSDAEMSALLLQSWNGYFGAEKTKWAQQRVVPNQKAYTAMLGNMWAEDKLGYDLLGDCFDFNTRRKTWGWPGAVDTSKLVDATLYEDVSKGSGSNGD